MAWLRIGCASIAIVIYLYLALQTLHIKKEFKGGHSRRQDAVRRICK
jgi:hypothetical protein